MTLNEYQDAAMSTCMPSCANVSYMLLNLQGEVGEFSSKIAKAIRKGDAIIDCCHLRLLHANPTDRERFAEELMAECGDIFWELAGLCKVMGWSLEQVGASNLAKLASRKQRGVIDGNGDNR